MVTAALPDIRAIDSLLGNLRATLAAVRAAPGGDAADLADTLDTLAGSASSAAFVLAADVVAHAAREAEDDLAARLAAYPRRSRRSRIPRPRGSLRAVPAVAAMVFAAVLSPHHLVRAAAGAAPVSAVASRPSPPRVPDGSKTAARTRERPAAELGRI